MGSDELKEEGMKTNELVQIVFNNGITRTHEVIR